MVQAFGGVRGSRLPLHEALHGKSREAADDRGTPGARGTTERLKRAQRGSQAKGRLERSGLVGSPVYNKRSPRALEALERIGTP